MVGHRLPSFHQSRGPFPQPFSRRLTGTALSLAVAAAIGTALVVSGSASAHQGNGGGAAGMHSGPAAAGTRSYFATSHPAGIAPPALRGCELPGCNRSGPPRFARTDPIG